MLTYKRKILSSTVSEMTPTYTTMDDRYIDKIMIGNLTNSTDVKGETVFKKLEKKYCKPKYGLYLTFDEASEACVSEENCKYIYDTECNKKGKFNLCGGNAEVATSFSSCVHEKTVKPLQGTCFIDYLSGYYHRFYLK